MRATTTKVKTSRVRSPPTSRRERLVEAALLHELNASGTTICVITHDNEIADSLPRRVRFKDGEIVSDSRSGARPVSPVEGVSS